MKPFVALAITIAAIAAAPASHADEPGVAQLICQQLALGQSPSEIEQELHEGDHRYSLNQTAQTFWDTSATCP